MGRERLEIEFGRHAGWMVEAIEELGLDAVPAACRGTGDPALFGRLAGAIGARPGVLVLDVGCGIGGPAAWLAAEIGCDVVGVDLIEEPVRGLRRLFPHILAVVGNSRSLPFGTAVFEATWALGVIETIEHKREALREIERVLAPGGRLAVYGYVVSKGAVVDAPVADRFQSVGELVDDFEGAGLEVVLAARTAERQPPAEWREAYETARAHAARAHRGDPSYTAVAHEVDKMSRLWNSGDLEAWIIVGAKERA